MDKLIYYSRLRNFLNMPSLVSSIYKQKRFLGWNNFEPWTYVQDYVIFQIWKTWHKESGAAVPPYIHWVHVKGCILVLLKSHLRANRPNPNIIGLDGSCIRWMKTKDFIHAVASSIKCIEQIHVNR